MKRVFTIISILFIAISLKAQTIHWLTFIDTTDSNVGQIDVFGRQMLYNSFINEVNAALAQKGYKSNIQDFNRYQVSPENCVSAIKRLHIDNPEDIIVFYYIGHGGRAVSDADYVKKHPFPQICLAQFDESKFVPLEWIDEQLSSKGAKLTVTIGMCCNNISDGISEKEVPNFSPNFGATYMSSNKLQRIQELFLSSKGHIIATSASPSQTSGCFHSDNCPLPANMCMNPAHYRDRYTFAICEFFRTELDKYNRKMTWDDFFNIIGEFVDRYSNHSQTPFYESYIDMATAKPAAQPKAPEKSEIEKTKSNQPSNATIVQGKIEGDNWVNDLTNYLSTLINVSLPISARQNLERELSQQLFSDDCKVRFLAQDSDDVIDKIDIDEWLGILATNPNGRILKIAVVEGSFDTDNKIKSLKVREIYKK